MNYTTCGLSALFLSLSLPVFAQDTISGEIRIKPASPGWGPVTTEEVIQLVDGDTTYDLTGAQAEALAPFAGQRATVRVKSIQVMARGPNPSGPSGTLQPTNTPPALRAVVYPKILDRMSQVTGPSHSQLPSGIPNYARAGQVVKLIDAQGRPVTSAVVMTVSPDYLTRSLGRPATAWPGPTQPGQPASDGLAALARDGNPAPYVQELAGGSGASGVQPLNVGTDRPATATQRAFRGTQVGEGAVRIAGRYSHVMVVAATPDGSIVATSTPVDYHSLLANDWQDLQARDIQDLLAVYARSSSALEDAINAALTTYDAGLAGQAGGPILSAKAEVEAILSPTRERASGVLYADAAGTPQLLLGSPTQPQSLERVDAVGPGAELLTASGREISIDAWLFREQDGSATAAYILSVAGKATRFSFLTDPQSGQVRGFVRPGQEVMITGLSGTRFAQVSGPDGEGNMLPEWLEIGRPLPAIGPTSGMTGALGGQ